MAKRLANVKTRRETGLDYVASAMNLLTPFGKKQIKEQKPFFPGEEEALREELERIRKMLKTAYLHPKDIEVLQELFMVMKDNTFTIERSENAVLSVVEIFELKSLLLQMEKLGKLSESLDFPKEFELEDISEILNVLDPGKERLNTFYIYDVFSGKADRAEKRKKGNGTPTEAKTEGS